MNSRLTKRSPVRTPKPARSTDSKGNVRVYIDLPPELVRRFNVLAAMRSVAKRVLLAQIVEEALTAAKVP